MYSQEAFNFAKQMVDNSDARNEFIKLLSDMGREQVYGNEMFDRKQILAECITKLMA